MYEKATVGPVRDYLIDLDVTKVTINSSVSFAASSISVTLPASFTNVDSYRAFVAPGTGSGGTINPNYVVTRTAVNKVTVATADGTTPSTTVDVIAFGY